MSKTVLKSNNYAMALCRDAFGNAWTGNEERSIRFIKAALQVLEAQSKVIETRGDVRATMELEKCIRDTQADIETWPKFSNKRTDESVQRWTAAGVSPDGVLRTVSADDAAQLGLQPGQPGESSSVKLDAEKVQTLLKTFS